MEEADLLMLRYEIEVLKNLYHPNIVRLYEVYDDDSSIFMVMEKCEGRELFEEIRSRVTFNEREAALVTKQILQAIAYCHERGVVHRDLKPENILLDTSKEARGSIKVIDFGTASVFRKDDTKQEHMNKEVGTAYYIAPEVINLHYTEKCDIWSIGVILYIMISGRPPFDGRNEREILTRVSTGVYSLETPEWKQTSSAVKDLISKMMEVDYNKRLSASQCLDHPWIKKKVKTSFDQELSLGALDNLRNFTVSILLTLSPVF